MKCYAADCDRDPTVWEITREASEDEDVYGPQFTAAPACEEHRQVAMAMVPADDSSHGDVVAMFDFRSGPPDL